MRRLGIISLAPLFSALSTPPKIVINVATLPNGKIDRVSTFSNAARAIDDMADKSAA